MEQDSKKKYKYHVIQFLELPYSNIDEYICIPWSWVRLRRKTDRIVKVRYPIEPPSQTIKRVKKRQKFSEEWRLYLATIAYDTDHYDSAEIFIATRNNYTPYILRSSDLENRVNKLLKRKTHSSKKNTHLLSNPFVKLNPMSEELLNINPGSEIKKELDQPSPSLPKLKIDIKMKTSQESVSEYIHKARSTDAELKLPIKSPPPPGVDGAGIPVCEDYSNQESRRQEILAERSIDIIRSEISTQNRPSVIQSTPNIADQAMNKKKMTEQDLFNQYLIGLFKEMHENISKLQFFMFQLHDSSINNMALLKEIMEEVGNHCFINNAATASSYYDEPTKTIIKEEQNETETYTTDDDDGYVIINKKRGRPTLVMGAVTEHCNSPQNAAEASKLKVTTNKVQKLTEEVQKEKEIYVDDDDDSVTSKKKCGNSRTVSGPINNNCPSKNNEATASVSKETITKIQEITNRITEAPKDMCICDETNSATASKSRDVSIKDKKETGEEPKGSDKYVINDDDTPTKSFGRARKVLKVVNDLWDSLHSAATASTSKDIIAKDKESTEEESKECEKCATSHDEYDTLKKQSDRARTIVRVVNDHWDSPHNAATASTSKDTMEKNKEISKEEINEREKYDIEYNDNHDKATKIKLSRPQTVSRPVNNHWDSKYNAATASSSKDVTTNVQEITNHITEEEPKGTDNYVIDNNKNECRSTEEPRTIMRIYNNRWESLHSAATATKLKDTTAKYKNITKEVQKERNNHGINDDDFKTPKKKLCRNHWDSKHNLVTSPTSKDTTLSVEKITNLIIEEEPKKKGNCDIDNDIDASTKHKNRTKKGQKERKTYVIDNDDFETPNKKHGRLRMVVRAVNDNSKTAPTSKDATPRLKENTNLIIEEQQKDRENCDMHDNTNKASKKKIGIQRTVSGLTNNNWFSRNNTTASTSIEATTKAQEISEAEQKRGRGEGRQIHYYKDDYIYDLTAPKKKRGKPVDFILPPEYVPNDSKWTLKYRKPAPGLIELMPDSGVFVDAFRFKYCTEIAKDCKSLARLLLGEIFTTDALSVCSVTGKKSNAFLNEGTDARPGLDGYARMMLLSFVEQFGRQNGWNVSARAINISISGKIQKMRLKYGKT